LVAFSTLKGFLLNFIWSALSILYASLSFWGQGKRRVVEILAKERCKNGIRETMNHSEVTKTKNFFSRTFY